MPENQINIPFGGKRVCINLPESWSVISELKPNAISPLTDISGSLIEGLKRPIGSPPLDSKRLSEKKIVIVVDDISRPTPTYQFFQSLLKYLYGCGVRKEDILIITALGVHRSMTTEDLSRKIGRGAVEGIRWINHNYKDAGSHIEVGRTKRGTTVRLNKHLADAGIIICVGLIEPHPLLGFGGGLKMLLPGLAHEETIAENHMQGVSGERFNYIGKRESPMRLDLEEAAMMLGKDIFIVNVILNQELKICRFVCGDPVMAHREGVKISESMCAKDIGELADVALVVSNPMNTDLRQGIKCIANAGSSVKEGGIVLALLECKFGIGDVAIPKIAIPHLYTLLRLILKLLGKGRILGFIDRFKKRAGVEERFLMHFSMQIARKNHIFVYSDKLPRNTGKRIGLFRQFADLEEMLRQAERYAPKNARVYVFPHGGATYTVCR